jgi:hypothetical protein
LTATTDPNRLTTFSRTTLAIVRLVRSMQP